MATRDGDDRGVGQSTVVTGGVKLPPAADSESSSPTSPIPDPAADDVIATLTAVEGDLQGDAYVLRAGENHLGRGTDCTIVMNSRWISRSHVRIICDNGQILLRVSEGKEVWVNDALAVEQVLVDGARIKLGTTILSLRTVDAGKKSASSVIPVTPSSGGVSQAQQPSASPAPAPPPAVAPRPAAPAPSPSPSPSAQPPAAAPPAARAASPAPPVRKKRKWRFWEKAVPSLVFVTGDRTGDRVELKSARFRIGGLDENDIVIKGNDASRNHAELRIRDGRVHIWDLRSVNGTWVNNERIENTELRFGDVIRIGSEELRYED